MFTFPWGNEYRKISLFPITFYISMYLSQEICCHSDSSGKPTVRISAKIHKKQHDKCKYSHYIKLTNYFTLKFFRLKKNYFFESKWQGKNKYLAKFMCRILVYGYT